jgi:hypothetical protein
MANIVYRPQNVVMTFVKRLRHVAAVDQRDGGVNGGGSPRA